MARQDSKTGRFLPVCPMAHMSCDLPCVTGRQLHNLVECSHSWLTPLPGQVDGAPPLPPRRGPLYQSLMRTLQPDHIPPPPPEGVLPVLVTNSSPPP